MTCGSDGNIYAIGSGGLQRCDVETVPEPTSILALLCGIGGMGEMIWKRRK
ncbi:MAG: PEP-CTERM sorting domain-containing protein [Armatimonadetes bacterium]|nr:PEP-CTERM sorting domain-containing protein [Armatimonadota bacterium]